MSTTMRAKMRVGFVHVNKNQEGQTVTETLMFHGVPKPKYDETGMDEDNTFAKFSPGVDLAINVANPALHGKFQVGDTFYLDFIPAE